MARRVISLLLVFLLITVVIGQGLVAGQTPDASQDDGTDPPPGEVVDDDSGSEPPAEPPVTDPPPPDEGDDGEDDEPPVEIPEERVVEPTEPVAEAPPPTDIPAVETDPTIPADDPTAEPTAFPTEDNASLPTETPTSTPEETPEPEPTERPANLDALNPIDVASGIALHPGESANFTYSYEVTTFRLATTLTAGLTGDTAGWTIALYAGNSESGPGIEVMTVEPGTTGGGGSFGVIVAISAPSEATGPQTVAFWLSSTATPDDGAPEEVGILADGPSVSLVDPANETPTSTPTEIPTPTMTPESIIPFALLVSCGPTGSDSGEWMLQECDVTWETEHVSAIQVRVAADAPGWTAVLVPPADAGTSDAIAASDAHLELVVDGSTRASQFVIATRHGCSVNPVTNLTLELAATSTLPVPTDAEGNPVPDVVETQVTEVVTESLAVRGRAAEAPQVSITSASFEPVDITANHTSTEGTVQVSYSDAPTGCAWQITVSYGDLVGGGIEIPAAGLELVEVTGLDEATISFEQGTLVVTPHGQLAATSGSFVITVSLDLPDPLPPGTFDSTVTASAELLP
jgi:hypothetical protein